MNFNFGNLRQDFYHRVAAGPFENSTTVLVGSDIVLHLPVLQYYASLCENVVEFGVREGQSTVALIAGCKRKVHSFDIQRSDIVELLHDTELPCEWEFSLLDTGNSEDASLVGETEMLFIDTAHTYEHVTNELRLHGRKATKFLAFHDTFTCGARDISGPNPNAKGILPAIEEWLNQFPGEYRTVYRTDVCNGLWVLERN